MAIRLPSTFKDVPLADLWQMLKIGDELKELCADDEAKAYFTGWHDCLAVLLGDLTHMPTITQNTELARMFEDFRMEDRLMAMDEELKRNYGSFDK